VSLAPLQAIALRLLTRREHSRVELAEKLLQRGFSVQDIEPLLDQLCDQDVQSDARFAENYLRYRVIKGYGPVRMRQELGDKGVSSDIVESALSEYNDQWQILVENVYQKKFGKSVIESYNEQAKRMAFLQYRGFNNDQIQQVISNKL
jgi:regulatory protein